ncbi:MAG: YraN family protein [Clostridium sp.]|nr:YraN family protein [Clostridium sp.]
MKKYNKDIGNFGEYLALSYLKNIGYKLLSKNFRTKYGEIDLIFIDNDVIVFIEVKSRYNYHFGLPREAITYSKEKQIINVSSYYLYKNELLNYNCRFDVIEVYFNTTNNTYKINHIIDAFRPY